MSLPPAFVEELTQMIQEAYETHLDNSRSKIRYLTSVDARAACSSGDLAELLDRWIKTAEDVVANPRSEALRSIGKSVDDFDAWLTTLLMIKAAWRRHVPSRLKHNAIARKAQEAGEAYDGLMGLLAAVCTKDHRFHDHGDGQKPWCDHCRYTEWGIRIPE